MSQINDEILRATGGPTVNDGLAIWFGKSGTESLNDAESRWLFSQVQVTVLAPINDMWLEFRGGVGQINDLKLKYWEGQISG